MTMQASAMTRLKLCLGLLAAITHVAAAATNSAAVKSLGRIVYLPDVNLVNDHNSDPLIFDPNDLNIIARTSEESYTDMNTRFFESSDKFKQSIATDMGLRGSYQQISFSVNAAFNRVSGSETEVKVAEVQAARLHSKTYLPRGSELNSFPLKKEFLQDFQNLPTQVTDPHVDVSWSPFRNFMNKWGSHIVHVAYTGAVYQSFSSSKSEKNYSQRDMEIKACVKAEGITGKALEACAGYSESERREASKLTTTDTKRVKGGSAATRSQLASGLATQELLQEFLSQDSVGEQPVRYEYLPVWDYLLGRSLSNISDAKRALGLQAYYEGWKAFTCPLVVTTGQTNNNAQMMVAEYTKEKQATGYYLCIRRCIGCHNYKEDCHYKSSKACCRSYGPSVLKLDSIAGFVTRATYRDSGWCDWDNGCIYKVFVGCVCINSNDENGCNYVYPLNPQNATWLKYNILWTQHEAAFNPHDTAASIDSAFNPHDTTASIAEA
ncbi:hypothetical protein MARPO_0205s0001 [Marchantia polymorpha]|uniref:MACPF domain-containing protein n=1 Tax=Marchantia polymorpha TaxID=3197 RepID=A0A2R6W0F9_MARPO|nr:hypothetical protein MARPO_0205s0001 [Marchantia polymorpha]|eukprot:PTQ27330.1 hypothetical protein MARPO_0205s0001 [Marchantia polymorpha]